MDATTMPGRARSIRTAIGTALVVLLLLAPTAAADGPGGPVLVITSAADPFTTYYSEILRAEGLNEFSTTDVSTVNAQTLAAHDVAVLAPMTLSSAQVSMLSDWVVSGGNLIAMRPDKKLAGLLGLTDAGGTLANGYLKIDTGPGPGAGITAATMQYHGSADRYSLNGAGAVAALYSDASTATANPAVTLRSVGGSGGQAAAFSYDLAHSVVYTRQGNPAWAGQKRDGASDPIRSDELFFPDWVDFDKIAIPQADEQQRLLANLITQMTLDRQPLPRFWYLPRGDKAEVVMSGDDHAEGNAGTVGQFQMFEAASRPGCSVADWQCVRSTSYLYPSVPDLSTAEAAHFQGEGFEIALHYRVSGPNECNNFTSQPSLSSDWDTQLAAFAAAWPNATAPRTSRTHCITWSDWATEPKVERSKGIRLDANYYYWPGAWVNDRPGLFTGSGFPMRFADLDGSTIDVYQAATQITDESNMTIPDHIRVLLDGALGANGYYGVFTANMHTDVPVHPGAQAIVQEAQRRGVSVISAAQMLDWLDGRNGSSFGALSFSAGRLQFTVDPAAGSRGLQAMVPTSAPAGALLSVTRNGATVSTTRRMVKGIEYAMFDGAAGSYVATYGNDATPPETTLGDVTVSGNAVRVTFAASEAGRFECSLDGGAFTACDSPATFGGLAAGSHTVRVAAIDLAGNVDPTPAERTFAIGAAGTGSGSTGGSGGTGGGAGDADHSAPRVTIAKRTVRATRKGTVTLRLSCPGTETRCRIDLQLVRGKQKLARATKPLAGGQSANLTLRLSRTAIRQLARAGALRVDAVLTARDAAGNHSTTRTRIKLLAPGWR
jgi:hypothetical protein